MQQNAISGIVRKSCAHHGHYSVKHISNSIQILTMMDSKYTGVISDPAELFLSVINNEQ